MKAVSKLAAEVGDSRLLWFNREEQQRYQWSTTAGSTSSREKCLMDVEHDIGFLAAQPHNSRHVTWYFSAHVWSGLTVLMWHAEVCKCKTCRKTEGFFFPCCLLHVFADKKQECTTFSWIRKNTQEGESDNTFPYAKIISSLRQVLCPDS